MTDALPAPVAGYFAAKTSAQMADRFTEDGVVTDERRTHRGRSEILRWREEVGKIGFQREILSSRRDGETVVVSCRVLGDFPGNPVDVDRAFGLAGDGITVLEIP